MNTIYKFNTLYKLQYDQQKIAQQVLLCCFVLCLIATTSLILTTSNNSYAKDMALLSLYDDSSTQGLVNVDGIYADAIRFDRQKTVDTTLVKEQLKFEQKLADLGFVLDQYQLMELQTFHFVMDMPKREQVTRMMLTHLQTMLMEFTTLNPNISANWKLDPNNALRIIVQLNTKRKRAWGGAGFMI